MADAEERGAEEKRSAEGKKQTKDLDTVTDYHEAREMDASKAQEAMAAVMGDADGSEDAAADAAREKELASVAVDAGDVAIIVKEFEVTKDEADRALRLSRGDLTQALTALVEQ